MILSQQVSNEIFHLEAHFTENILPFSLSYSFYFSSYMSKLQGKSWGRHSNEGKRGQGENVPVMGAD